MVADELSCDVAATFVRLADTLVEDYDVVDFASTLCHETRRLLDTDAAGVMLVAGSGHLRILASTSEPARALESFEVECGEGPSIDAYLSGATVVAPDLSRVQGPTADGTSPRWRLFTEHAVRCGFQAVSAVPMWVRGTRIGVLSLFDHLPRARAAEDLALAEGLADIASIGILSARRVHEEHVLAEQLQRALSSRIVIEQAKGTLAERLGIDVDAAFTALRDHARSHRRHLTDIAQDLVDGHLDGAEFSIPQNQPL